MTGFRLVSICEREMDDGKGHQVRAVKSPKEGKVKPIHRSYCPIRYAQVSFYLSDPS